MILSFHPFFSGDRYINCAGRRLTDADIEAMQAAWAIILPQACPRPLYEAARQHCPRVFPDFSTKFDYPGKVGQIALFRRTGTPHPETWIYRSTEDFYREHGRQWDRALFRFPLIFKDNWSDEGYGVVLLNSQEDLVSALKQAAAEEKSGWTGFLLQRCIDTRRMVLRVVVIYKRFFSYWRIGRENNDIRVNLAQQADIDTAVYPRLQEKGRNAVRRFCRLTGLNLAGLDLVFPGLDAASGPLFLEINYYFGRRGLGGSDRFYQLLIPGIAQWIEDQENAQEKIL